MNFISYAFLTLFALALLARVTIGRRSNAPAFLWLLLALSLVFYGWFRWSYLLIMFTSAGIDFWAGLLLVRPGQSSLRRKLILAVSMASNLGLLAFFKYTNFALDSIASGLTYFGAAAPWQNVISITLPIGISFYTFQSMSYTIDVYRGQLKPTRSFWRFMLFVAFFPQLVAGPIVRAVDFLYQFHRPRHLRAIVLTEGAALIARGLFLKMVCADTIGVFLAGVPNVSPGVWETGYKAGADSQALWLYVALFSAQIFCDFAGYSDIARGTAYVLGFRLPINFLYPYIATSFSDFWRRWHISLSTWLRDYLYRPLGGNRKGRIRTYVNLLVVMLLGGLWHGAAWTFVVWGAIHGSALAVERLFGLPELARRPARSWIGRLGKLLWMLPYFVVVQLVVALAWVYFRSDTIANANIFVANLFTWPQWTLNPADWELQLVAATLVPVAAMHLRRLVEETFAVTRIRPFERAFWVAVMVYLTLSFYGRANDFIYFQF
jgi:D-alanyl-lipoteichoic acid acyltransferase DltB (MBOAT superfamily)